jgi:hypothetical protein
MKFVGFAVCNNGMARIPSAIESYGNLEHSAKEVRDLALALITKLQAENSSYHSRNLHDEFVDKNRGNLSETEHILKTFLKSTSKSLFLA